MTTHVNNIFSKTNVNDRAEAAMYAIRHRLIELTWCKFTAEGTPNFGAVAIGKSHGDFVRGLRLVSFLDPVSGSPV